MHLYNAWLPPPVAEQVGDEKRRFSEILARVREECGSDDPSTRFNSVQWTPIINVFFKAKSDLSVTDLEMLSITALNLILASPENLFIQHRWGQCVRRILKKYRHKLDLKIEWRPLYRLLLDTHFERRHSYEGYALKRNHLNTVVALVRSCRRFFPPGSAAEIWQEFRPAFEDISHNSALEAVGFLSLFLPTTCTKTVSDSLFFTSDWVRECLYYWAALPHSPYWNLHWASLLNRCIKSHPTLDWEPFLPTLFMHYLRSFEVPVGKAGAWPPVLRRIPREVLLAFYTRGLPSTSAVVARSIVNLLAPGVSTQGHLDNIVDLLEQYYHPSNGGSWTGSLERFLLFLVIYFLKRLAREQLIRSKCEGTVNWAYFLGPPERVAFVKAVMRLIERGQYSKNVALAASAVTAASLLTYVEPLIVLPLIVSGFQIAMNTITATHQLESALTTLALAARPLLLASARGASSDLFVGQDRDVDRIYSGLDFSLAGCQSTLVMAMFNTLLGMDANDPPKTLATLQLYCSVLSSVRSVGVGDGDTTMLSIDWSQWVDMFLSRLFVLLLNLEPSTDTSSESDLDDGFLMEAGSQFSALLGLLFEKATPPVYQQALKMVSKFVNRNILPGAVDEIGVLCSAAVYANPTTALTHLAKPIMNSVISSLCESPSTGYSRSGPHTLSHDFKVGLSPALEATVSYQLNVLSTAVMFGGGALPEQKELLKTTIAAAFDAPSSKVNEAGNSLLSSTIGSMIHFYPLGQFNMSNGTDIDVVEEWFSQTGNSTPKEGKRPSWHIPNEVEMAFANELVELHLQNALADLQSIVQEVPRTKQSGQERERLRVVLLRLDGSLHGVGSCLPYFQTASGELSQALSVVGAAGTTISTTALRQEVAETLHIVCNYMLKERADDTILLKLLVRLLDVTGNYGSTDYNYWSHSREVWEADAKTLTESPVNFITNQFSKGRRRPWWMLVERVNLHSVWRASQTGYHSYYKGQDAPHHVMMLSKDLLRLSLHSYSAVRTLAGAKLGRILKRYPALIKECMPLATVGLQDAHATEETALGACMVLMSKPVMRHLMQNWGALASFLLALLGSSHHESVKAQNAINELFIVFNFFYGGVPYSSYTQSGESLDEMTYFKMITHIQAQVVHGGTVTVHWRYNLMAHGMLLFLLLPPQSVKHSSHADTVLKSRESIAGGFMSNLQSELPALRPLSVIALLFLLQATSPKVSPTVELINFSSPQVEEEEVTSLRKIIISILQGQGFGHKVVGNLAVDHHYFEGQNSYNPQQMSDVGLTSLMPTFMRDWPRTRTVESNLEGEAFSSTFARFFQYLVEECGVIALDALKDPLHDACNEVEERGKQCIAAEIMAGFLHSDAQCVVEAWESWLCPLLRKALLQSTVESASEWAACVRFAVGGKGVTGQQIPVLRYKILVCLAELLPDRASTSLLTKRLTLLRAAISELLPGSGLDEDFSFQASLLDEVITYMSHRAPQVRQGVGRILCMLCANLLQLSTRRAKRQTKEGGHVGNGMISDSHQICKNGADLGTILVNGAVTASAKIRIESGQHLGEESSVTGSYSAEGKEAVRWMETVLHFVIASVRSGNGTVLINVTVELIHPLLSLQDTWHKELAKLAKTAMQLMRWQPFGIDHLGAAVRAVLAAATDSNWHTRVAALKFSQPLVYRHTFIIASCDMSAIWDRVRQLLSDPQLEVRELAATTLAGMMKGLGSNYAEDFRKEVLNAAKAVALGKSRSRKIKAVSSSIPTMHGLVLGLAACVLSVPYDMPSWLPETVISLAQFIHEAWPVRATVTKTIGEFRRTHLDTWDIQKASFSEEQLEVLADLTSSASYFA